MNKDNMSIVNLFERAKTFRCIDDHGIHNMNEILRSANRLVSFLMSQGMNKGDRILLCAQNSVTVLSAIYAVAKCSGVLVPMGIKQPELELKRRIDTVEARFAIFSKDSWEELSNKLHATNITIILVDDDMTCEVWKQMSSTSMLAHKPLQERFLNGGIILFTSGTSSAHSSAVVLAKDRIVGMLQAVAEYTELTSADVLFVSKHYYHVSTLIAEILLSVYLNATLSLRASTLLLPRICIKNMQRDCATVLFGNPHILAKICKEYTHTKIPSLRLVYSSGSVLSSSLHEELCKKYAPAKVFNVYGLTEAGPRVLAQCANDEVVFGSAGKPLTGVRVVLKQYDVETHALRVIDTPNTLGELFVYSKYVMLGYLGDGERERQKLCNGELRTNDLAYYDNQGMYHVLCRSDDVMLIGSMLVAPSLVEDAMLSYPSITACAVFGVKKGQDDEKIVALYTTDDNAEVIKTALMKHLQLRLEAYQIPSIMLHRNSLPYSEQGKLLRNQAKQEYLDSTRE